jgi:uncharacterized membrane protein YcaP (DUF421 family)
MDILIIILRSVAVYLFIIIAIRLFGKHELTQLSVIDLVLILLISNSVQNAMVGPDTSLLGGLIAAGSLFVVNFALRNLLYRSPRLNSALQGHPRMLVYHGHMVEKNLREMKVSKEELESAVREHGVATIEDVDLAVLEIDGTISVLSENFHKRTVKARKPHKVLTKNE